jgi:hypothetical protein
MRNLKTFLSAVRDLLGWGDSPQSRLSPPHGWLLPAASELRAARARVQSLRAEALEGGPTPRG